jgi:hypothetical protein
MASGRSRPRDGRALPGCRRAKTHLLWYNRYRMAILVEGETEDHGCAKTFG